MSKIKDPEETRLLRERLKSVSESIDMANSFGIDHNEIKCLHKEFDILEQLIIKVLDDKCMHKNIEVIELNVSPMTKNVFQLKCADCSKEFDVESVVLTHY